MSECGPDFNVRVVDGCTGDPIPGAEVSWIGLGPFPAYPGGPDVPCAVSTAYSDTADGSGLATVVGVWMNSGGVSQHRVTVVAGTSGEADYRYGAYYLDNSMSGTIDLAAYPAGGCPPGGGSGGTGSGSCSDCGSVEVITGPVGSLPFGVEQPVGWKGMGAENPADRCTASTARVVGFLGACFPGVQWLETWNLADVFGAGGALPMDWHEPVSVETAGAATAAMIHALMENQRFLSMQLSYCMTMLERQAIWSNQLNEALNARLLFLNESLQVLGSVLHGEGWLDRVTVTREDPYSASHPEIV